MALASVIFARKKLASVGYTFSQIGNSMKAAITLERSCRMFFTHSSTFSGFFNTSKASLVELLQAGSLNSETLVDLLMIAKYYERIGDHAVNIAKWVLFSLTGSLEFASAYFEEGGHISEK